MKKTFFVLIGFLVILGAGCNEKSLINDITGTWHVQKYAVDGIDKTHMFDSIYPIYTISFLSDKKYYRAWQTHGVGIVYNVDTTRHFDSVSGMIVIDNISVTEAMVPYAYTYNLKGDWLLTNANKFIETRDSVKNTLFEIIDHSNGSLHLYTGNEDYYLSK